MIIPLLCFFSLEDRTAFVRNPALGYNIVLLRLIPGDLNNACPHRQLDTPLRLHCQTPTPSRQVFCTIFMMVIGMTRIGYKPMTCRMTGGPAR